MVTRRLVAAVLVLSAASAWGRSLSDTLGIFQPGEVTITPSILQLQRELARATDFPATTTTPGFVYRYDPESGSYARVSGTLGPAFLERAETVGAGHFDLAFSYVYARYTQTGDESLSESLSSKFLSKEGSLIVPQRIDTRDFSLTSHVMYFSATYGIDDETDVNLLLPLYYTVMEGKRRFSVLGQFGNFESLDNRAFGPGDLLVRAKRHFLQRGSWDLAAGFAMELPSGSEANFQGLGDVIVSPSLIASWIGPSMEAHGTFGVDIDAGDLQRSGVRYGVGGSYAPIDRLTLLVDIVGTIGFSVHDLSFFVPDRRLLSLRGEFGRPLQAQAVWNGTRFPTTLPRLDVVDLAVGVQVQVYGNIICFVSAIVPLTNDGPHADVIPTGGIQYGF